MLSERVLLVDDEPRVGRSYARALRKVVALEQAESGAEALAFLEETGPVAVVVSDMRMARMDGIDLLQAIARHYPDTTRIMLTGNLDQRSATRAINEGGVFRYLTKPCDAWTFGEAVVAGVRRYQVRRAERELLDFEHDGAQQLARELLKLINPKALARLPQLDVLVRGLCAASGTAEHRNQDVIPLLALLGAGVPEVEAGAAGTEPRPLAGGANEHQFTELAFRLATAVPGLAQVARAIRYQFKNFDGSGLPDDAVRGADIPLLGRILRLALAFDWEMQRLNSPEEAFAELLERRAWFDFNLLCALARHLGLPEPEAQEQVKLEGVPVDVRDLAVGMVLSEPVQSRSGAVLMSRGKVLDANGIARLRAFAEREQIPEDIRVFDTDEAGEGGLADSA